LNTNDDALKTIERELGYALAVEVFVEFSFVVAMLATGGAFNGGQPTTTPPGAVAYFVIGFIVTIGVIVRTGQMRSAARRGDIDALRKMHLRALTFIALVFSAILPSYFLSDAAAVLRQQP
jgi:hypothetical protein